MLAYNYEKQDSSLPVIENQLCTFKNDPGSYEANDMPSIHLIHVDTFLLIIKSFKDNKACLLKDVYDHYFNLNDIHFTNGDN